MSFFSQFPNLLYDLKNNNRFINAKNIFRHVDVNDVLAEDITTYTYYEVQEGERPDTVSQILYGTPDYYWTFFLIDDKMKEGLYSWPKDPQTLEREMQLEFDDMGALVLLPKIRPDFILHNMANSPTGINSPATHIRRSVDNITNTPAGLDLSYKDLRIKRNGKYAKIVNWDNDLLQLKLTHFSDTADGEASSTAKATFFTTPGTEGHDASHTGTAKFAFVDSDNAAADSPSLDSPRIDFIKSMALNLTTKFVDYSPNIYDEDNIISSAHVFQLFDKAIGYYNSPSSATDGLKGIIFNAFDQMRDRHFDFSPKRTYSDFRNAPAYYYGEDEDSTDYDYIDGKGNVSIISAYDAFHIPTAGGDRVWDSPDIQTGDQFSSVGPDRFISNYELELNANDEKRKIKVIRPEYIADFVERYQELINS